MICLMFFRNLFSEVDVGGFSMTFGINLGIFWDRFGGFEGLGTEADFLCFFEESLGPQKSRVRRGWVVIRSYLGP